MREKIRIMVQHKVTKEQGELVVSQFNYGWYCVKLKSSVLVWDEAYQWERI